MEIKRSKSFIVQDRQYNIGVQYEEMGSKGDLLSLVGKLKLLTMELGLTIQTEHIPGVQNRTKNTLIGMMIRRDYKLNPDILRKACMELKIWPTIDGFASRTNKQRRRYCS
ncbi:MAG: hypothetical protein EZS28_016699 [Streblomastix strix]|uniref:Uncharacterized protein n=1 Tax=Streblomastix strix TaxID=222440 RepID=A0A5J4VZT6_9EUKA|nr:MAG: hypothetical protein EZS28_016699 [Streblomastix strix]